MNTLSSDQDFGTSIGWQFTARSNDGSLEDALAQFTALLTTLFTWIQLQLNIAGVAADLIVEVRVLVAELTTLTRLLIEIARRVNGVLDWIEDLYLVVTQDIPESWGVWWFKRGWCYETIR